MRHFSDKCFFQVQSDLQNLAEGVDFAQLARAMASARRSPFYSAELER